MLGLAPRKIDGSVAAQAAASPGNNSDLIVHDLSSFASIRSGLEIAHVLKIGDEALEAIADLAMERKVGARGLRMILEDLMLDLMYYLPSYKKVREFQVTKEMVLSQKISLTLLEKAG